MHDVILLHAVASTSHWEVSTTQPATIEADLTFNNLLNTFYNIRSSLHPSLLSDSQATQSNNQYNILQ
jgi:hypothetical protein